MLPDFKGTGLWLTSPAPDWGLHPECTSLILYSHTFKECPAAEPHTPTSISYFIVASFLGAQHFQGQVPQLTDDYRDVSIVCPGTVCSWFNRRWQERAPFGKAAFQLSAPHTALPAVCQLSTASGILPALLPSHQRPAAEPSPAYSGWVCLSHPYLCTS